MDPIAQGVDHPRPTEKKNGLSEPTSTLVDSGERQCSDQMQDKTQYPPALDPNLSQLQLDILDFERRWWKTAGSKNSAIRAQFDLSSTRYYQLLNITLDHPAALEYDPIVVTRLRKAREARKRSRTASRRGFVAD